VTTPVKPHHDPSPASEEDPAGFHLPTPCSATRNDGQPCGFAARRDSGLCINHDPAYAKQQRANVLKGSSHSRQARKQAAMLSPGIDLFSATGIQAALDLVVRLELSGAVSSSRSRNLIRALSLASRNRTVTAADAFRRPAELSHYRLLAERLARHVTLAALTDDDHRA
jgi:hypothetical protein